MTIPTLLDESYPASQVHALEETNPIAKREHFYSFSYVRKLFSVPLEETKRMPYPIPNTGEYCFTAYAPQALAILVARMLPEPSVGRIYYAGRLGNLFFVIVCIFLSLRLLPEKRLLILLLSFAPMFLIETASCSADGVLYALGILGTSYLLSLRSRKEPLMALEIFLIGLLAVLLGTMKQVYGILLLCCLFVPKERFGGGKKYFCFMGGIFLLYFASATGWLHVMRLVGDGIVPFPNGVDPAKQMQFVFSEPLRYLEIFFSSCWEQMPFYVQSFLGILGWISVYLPTWFYVFYGSCILLAGIYGNLHLKISQRMIVLGGIGLLIFVLHLHLYLTWTPVGAELVMGVQGRYIMPVSLLLFSTLSCKARLSHDVLVACVAACVSSGLTIWTTFAHFY